MNRGRGALVLLLVPAVLSVPLAIATNLAAGLLPDAVARSRPLVWGAVGLLWLATILVAAWQLQTSRRRGAPGRQRRAPGRRRWAARNLNLQLGHQNLAKQQIVYGSPSPPPAAPLDQDEDGLGP